MKRTFRVGEMVIWSSQSQGSWKTKTGIVVAIVPEGRNPAFAISGGGLPRDHESYVIEVKTTGKAKPKLYWPRVSQLRRV